MTAPTGARLAKGTRVRLSKAGRRLYEDDRRRNREGHIVGYSRYDGHPGVHWDGLSKNTVYHYHPSFIEPVLR